MPEHGLYSTARALHLDYGGLKQHVAATGAAQRGRVPSGFVELAVSPARDPWLSEIEGSGATIRLRLHGLALTNLADFTRRVVGAGA